MSNSNQPTPVFWTSKKIIIVLMLSNVVCIFLLLNIQRNISNAKSKREMALSFQDTLKYDDNPLYKEQSALFEVYQPRNVQMVMLGSSFTQRVEWHELLNRHDIANQGIGSDITEGYLHRLQYVKMLNPQICFIEAGANDLLKKIPIDSIYHNMTLIVKQLESAIPEIVITKCFYVTASYPNYLEYNLKVDSLNQRLAQLNKVTWIDINPQINVNHQRNPAFALADGIHLNAQGYLIWKQAIEQVLMQKKMDIH
jgi:lysophospholipase L1-like esterase